MPSAVSDPAATETVVVSLLQGHQHALALGILVLLAALVPLGLLAVSWLAHRSRHNNPSKGQPYECGLQAVTPGASDRFQVKFYLIAMLFLIFDLEVAFLYPWAVHFQNGGWGMLAILLVFLLMLEVGYIYLYRKGALDWER